MEEISFDEFQKLDMRVGKVVQAERVEGSRNLIKLQVDFGSEKLQAVSGIAQQYTPEDIIGKKYMFIINLVRRKFMGIESQCMIFAAEDEKGNLALMVPDKDIEEGSIVH
jgi:methionine--tRNA ligase beta chain